MTAKPVVPRAKARADVDFAVEFYTNEAGADVAFSFIDALEQAYTFIGETPAAGSPQWSYELNLPGLKTIRFKGFLWLVFYLEFETHVDVWRVLHARRDMPAWCPMQMTRAWTHYAWHQMRAQMSLTAAR